MHECIDTIVFEPRALVREALVSLMIRHSYRIVGSFASTADMENSLTTADAPRVVILGALAGDVAVVAACTIRQLWPEAKIVLLFDNASLADAQKLVTSEIDGCIPLYASPDTLIGTLQQIVAGNVRIMVLKTEKTPMPAAAIRQREDDESNPDPNDPARSEDARRGVIDSTSSIRIIHGLSQREEEILKSVVRGHSNKMIARTCGVADATIKVHMKSILRKIRVANRTQAAIWALEQGYGADGNRRPAPLRPIQGLAAA
jgi:two-component system nitrate/nitrite response regulator NarL